MGHRSSTLRNTCPDLLSDGSERVECLDLLHPLNHRHTKGTPFLAIPTGNTVLRPSAQRLVVSPDGLWNLGLHRRQVVELVDHGDVYALILPYFLSWSMPLRLNNSLTGCPHNLSLLSGHRLSKEGKAEHAESTFQSGSFRKRILCP